MLDYLAQVRNLKNCPSKINCIFHLPCMGTLWDSLSSGNPPWFCVVNTTAHTEWKICWDSLFHLSHGINTPLSCDMIVPTWFENVPPGLSFYFTTRMTQWKANVMIVTYNEIFNWFFAKLWSNFRLTFSQMWWLWKLKIMFCLVTVSTLLNNKKKGIYLLDLCNWYREGIKMQQKLPFLLFT